MTHTTPILVGSDAIDAQARRVLVFGGTFDPPHRAHIELPEAARQHLAFDWVLLVPAARSPHKARGPEASDEDRVAMLAAAISDHACARGVVPSMSVCTLELDRARSHAGAEPSYTVDTLRALRAARPDVTFRLLIGADQALSFDRWRCPREIIALAEPAVMLRAPSESPDALFAALRDGGAWSGPELAAWQKRIVPVPLIDASATSVRRAIALSGVDDPTVSRELCEPVRRLIAQRGLYGARGERSP